VKFFSAFLLFVFSTTVQAGPLGYNPGRLMFDSSLDWFQSGANYDETGVVQDLVSDSRLEMWSLGLRSRYDFSERVSAFVGMGAAVARAVSPTTTVTRFTPTDVHVGADYGIPISGFLLIPELKLSYPLNPVVATQTVPITGEGAWLAQGGGYLSVQNANLLLYGYAGYAFRGEGRSSLLPWLFHASFRVNPIVLSAEIGGYQSITNDKDAGNSASRKATQLNANAGSWRYYSVNPNLIELRLLGGFQAGPDLLFQAGYGRTLFGQRTAMGQSFIAQVTFGLDFDPTRVKGRNSSWGEDSVRAYRYKPEDSETEFQPDIPEEPEDETQAPPKAKPNKKRTSKVQETTEEAQQDAEPDNTKEEDDTAYERAKRRRYR
jgi:hypothetical protein